MTYVIDMHEPEGYRATRRGWDDLQDNYATIEAAKAGVKLTAIKFINSHMDSLERLYKVLGRLSFQG